LSLKYDENKYILLGEFIIGIIIKWIFFFKVMELENLEKNHLNSTTIVVSIVGILTLTINFVLIAFE